MYSGLYVGNTRASFGVNMDERRAPLASGTFAATPFAHVLVFVRNKRLSGVLSVALGVEHSGSLTFWKGRLTAATVSPPGHYLGAVLYELGSIDSETLDRSLLELSKKTKLHGEILVASGAITEAQRDGALVEQVLRKTQRLFGLPPESSFEFVEDASESLEQSVRVDPLTAVWRGIRAYPPDAYVQEVLRRYQAAILNLVGEVPVPQTSFESEERELLELLSLSPQTLDQLRAQTQLSPARVDLLVYFLLIGKCIQPTSASATLRHASSQASPAARPAGSQPPPRRASDQRAAVRTSSSPPSSVAPRISEKSPALPQPPRLPYISSPTPSGATSRPSLPNNAAVRQPMRLPSAGSLPMMSVPPPSRPTGPSHPASADPTLDPATIAKRAAAIEREDYFTALGIEEGSTVEAIRAAYFNLAKTWHPDRLPPHLRALRRQVETVFSHMTRAYQALSEPTARQSYVAENASPRPESRSREAIVREIEGYLAKSDYTRAEIEARALHESSNDDVEAMAIVAWARALGGEASEEIIQASCRMLDRAVHSDRYCDRAYFYRGLLMKKLGQLPAAFRDFTRAVQINPKHLDAAREVRLYEMRARKGSGEHAFGKLPKGKGKK